MEILGLLVGGLSVETMVTLAIVLAAAGFVSGLSGFGFSAIGAATLWILPPQKAIPLLMALSTINQLASLQELRSSIKPLREWWHGGPAQYILGGFLGLPIGLWALRVLSTAVLCAGVGAILIAYSAWSIFKPPNLRVRRVWSKSEIMVGALGGIIGGFTAFPGGAVVIWAGLIGMNKTEQRAVVQPYILTMQLVALAILAISGVAESNAFGPDFWVMLVCLTPIVIPFTKLGLVAFRRISDIDFKRITNGLLGVSGTGLMVKGSAAIVALGHWTKVIVLAWLFST